MCESKEKTLKRALMEYARTMDTVEVGILGEDGSGITTWKGSAREAADT